MKASSVVPQSTLKRNVVMKFEMVYRTLPTIQLAVAHGTICKIYTDWANHYLEKARNKRHIVDLQNDVADGVLLAEVIEAVTPVLTVSDRPPTPEEGSMERVGTELTNGEGYICHVTPTSGLGPMA
ncbi:Neuron navigator 3 [Bulinus truncatus]|nr:Neuron navigator 3 [Bulinus truncatus]